MEEKKLKGILLTIPFILILLGFAHQPIEFYQLLRWATLGCIGYFIYIEYNKDENNALIMTILGLIILVYNPILQLRFSRSEWQIINLITIFIYIAIAL